MKLSKKFATLGLALGLASFAQAADIYQDGVATGWADASGNVTISHTMTADHVYSLVGQVYVTDGATLTIQAGTRIASTPIDQGSLAIARGSKIIAVGTASKPIVFTSTSDTGTDRTGINEWGNLTLMGNALIGAEYTANNSGVRSYQDGVAAPVVTNTGTPTGLNKATMEGLVAGFTGDGRVLYGGADDNDDSGTLAYVSLRFGGKVIGVNSELNGLSMGAIGRNTDVHHIDIFQNIDDGIETWGGTVNYKYLNIWYVGDDSFDVDQGWRGKAQFGLIVQGYGTISALTNGPAQGSGIGDNAFETDGAERNDAVPTTTATLYNFTVIGQPDGLTDASIPLTGIGSDHATAWRDNARVQYRNMLFMKIGQNIVLEEPSEGTPTNGWRYGTNGVPTWANIWTMAYTKAHDTTDATTGNHANCFDYLDDNDDMDQAELEALYASQSAGTVIGGMTDQGKLCEITDSLFYSNANAAAYNNADGADARGVTIAGGSAATKGNVVTATLPIKKWALGTGANAPKKVNNGTLVMHRFDTAGLDPRLAAMNADTTSLASAPNDGFFTPAQYRGAFSDQTNWALGWTAASEFGMFDASTPNPSNPQATVVAFGTSFQTEVGKNYVVESSTDGVIWTPVSVIVGDGTIKSISPLTANTLYRVSVQ